MIRKFTNINDFKYCIEYDNSDNHSQYVMIRNFSLMNDVVCDTNIYFIEEGILENLKKQIINKEQIDCIVFPTSTNLHYSNYYNLYNDLMIDADILDELSIYHLYNIDKENKITAKEVKQDVIRIYHPHIKSTNNLIVHIDNIINNIHIHYICNLYKNFPINSENEIREYNNIYSEYIEILFPNVKDLFGISFDNDGKEKYSTYYLEDLNVVDTTSIENKDFIEDIVKILNDGKDQYVPLSLLTQPFLLEQYGDTYKKKYFKHNISVGNNFLITPINVTLFPFDYVDNTNNLYILDKDLKPTSESFSKEYKFKLNSVCDFSDGTISLIAVFDYPEKQSFDDNFGKENSLSKAYCYFNGIENISKYNEKYETIYKEYMEELDEIRHIEKVPEEDKKFIVSTNTKALRMNSSQLLEEYKKLKMESFLEEYIDEYKADINFFGFRIEISSDIEFKHIIYSNNISLSNNYLKNYMNLVYDDEIKNSTLNLFSCLDNNAFTFKINDMFDNWLQMPEIIVARIYFIDRFLGNVIQSNDVVINKEKFKYIINDIDYHRSKLLTNCNNQMITEYTLKEGEFNFIDKINCTIHNDTENNLITISEIKNILASSDTDSKKIQAIQDIMDQKNKQVDILGNTNRLTHIIYKPVFFKTSDGDNIQIRKNQIQNIGIDIHEYSRQSELFILNLDDKQYKETARNTNYAIFEIDAKALSSSSGTYDLYNDGYEYITSGTWIIV